MKRTLSLFFLLLCTSIYAQEFRVSSPRRDSVVVDDGEGHRSVTWTSRPYGPSSAASRAEATIKRGKREPSVLQHVRSVPSRELGAYSPGSIPFEESVSPSGGRIYSIPIATAAGWKLAPSIALVYNSQAGNNVGGYGWGLSGLSEISVRNRNLYYDGVSSAGLYDSSSACYSLDGIPLVQSDMGVSDYGLSTARGKVLVRKHYSATGRALYFSALYPDGSSAIFGSTSNSSPRSVYPITQYTDIEGNTMSFSYITYDNCYYISSISYGDNAQISFTYSTRTDGPPYKYARSGEYFGYPKRLLKTITSKDGNETIFQYTLTHELTDGVSQLTELHCTSGSSEVPPLLFEYGSDAAGPGGTPAFTLVDQSYFPTYFQQHPDTTILYKRGRLVPGNQDDAIVSLPSFSTYEWLVKQWSWQALDYCYKYGSKYSADQKILCNFTGYMYATQRTILAEEGFQLIEAVDTDGDGIDELVKINNWSSSSHVTTYKITIYSFDSSCNYTSSSFNVTVSDGTSNALFNNPVKSYYRFGTYRGDGRMMLLIMTRNASKFALVDLAGRQKLSESTLFTTGDLEDNLVISADFENDGKTDLCHVTDTGMDVYSISSSTGTSFSLRTTYAGVSKSLLYTDPWHTLNGSHEIFSRIYTLDINGDGYLDIMSAPALNVNTGVAITTDIWNIARFNGKQFTVETNSVYLRDQDDAVIFLDVDKDGLPDMLHLHGTSLLYSQNANGIFTNGGTYTQLSLDAYSGLVPGDISLFGTLGDILVVSGPFVNIYEFSVDHIQRRGLGVFTDSFGNTHYNQYGRTGGNSPSYLIDTGRSYSSSSGFSRLRAPLNVLENGYTLSGGQLASSVSYLYWDAVWHSRGLGFCGFGKTLVTDGVNMVYTTTRLNPEKFGVAEEISASKSSTGTPYSSVVNTYDNNSTTYGKLNPRLTKSVSNDSLTGVETTTTYTYGSYDLPSSVLTSRRIGSGTAQTEQLQRTYQNSVVPTKYTLGVVTQESVIKEGDGSSSLKWKEKDVFTYDGCNRPLTRKHYVGRYGRVLNNPHPLVPTDSLIIFPGGAVQPNAHVIDTTNLEPLPDIIRYDATNLVSEVQWQYDSNGNVISEKKAPYGATEFIGNTYTYDNSGRYLSRKTDPLGCYITYNNYNKFGKPRVVVNDRGHVSYYSYDDWGNVTEVTRPDGGSEQSAISWGGSGLYTVSSTATGRPEAVTHYDARGREIRSGEKRFDGQWQWVDRTYDSKGRLYEVSLPYRGSSPAYWNTYAYDQYGRPISLTETSGKTSTWSYAGTSVTTVKNGITSTSTTDANGNVVSVTDAGGTITYTLRDDGKPSKITAPGNVETTFTYDEYGRRTKMVDPSAGTQTDAFEWYSDGSSKLTHTNGNGTVKTYQDKYGRTTLIERPGEYNTAYTYDPYGRVTAEQSTNGTGKEYTYDNYDRVVTAKETVPDGKWLQKVHSYSSGSVLATIQYVNQSGTITTETYTYSNGHNTGVMLPDGTSVWTLTGENDLGMPTAITTGTVSREYGYTAYGMPTYRRMNGGNLQNFTYSFDVTTGNLLSRSDAVNGQTETFGYDNLNRLVSMGSRQITYADNGNILSVDGVGVYSYDGPFSPYRLGALTPEGEIMSLVEPRQNVIYNSAEHPESISQNGISASFTYNGSDDRVKIIIADNADTLLTRYYIEGRYEYELSGTVTKERLYLGGDAYSAPMVLQRENSGNWTAYNIGRDYLGNITHVATTGGTLVAEYSYDPWGRLRDPETLAIYTADNVPDLFLGRGFTGHEHLPWFSLVNMNARLYDPLTGRFLSHDPYVQAPDFTQNYNRYSYCLNNPLRYTDESGEFVVSTAMIIASAIGASVGLISGYLIGKQNGATGWAMVGNIAGGGLIGGLAGFAGSFVSGALASISGAGFLGGALSGGASAAASGFISGTGFSMLTGKSYFHALWDGFKSAGTGFLIGGTLGGLYQGISDLRHGGNFWTGEGAIEEYINGLVPKDLQAELGEGMEYSNEYARAFADKNFGPKSSYGVDRLNAEMKIPGGKGYEILGDYVVKDGQIVHAISVKGSFGKGSLVNLYKTAFTSKEMLYLSIGHEYFHSYLWSIGLNGDHHPIINHWQALQANMWEIPNSSIQYMTNYWQESPFIDTGYSLFGGIIPIKPYWWRGML